MADRKLITLTLNVLTLPDGGETVIPSQEDLKKQQRYLQEMLEDIDAEIGEDESETNKESLKARRSSIKAFMRKVERAIREQPDLLEECQKVVYKIFQPSYGDALSFEKAGRIEGDVTRADQAKMIDYALPRILDGLTEEQVQAIPPLHVQHIWTRWKAAAYPSNELLPA